LAQPLAKSPHQPIPKANPAASRQPQNWIADFKKFERSLGLRKGVMAVQLRRVMWHRDPGQLLSTGPVRVTLYKNMPQNLAQHKSAMRVGHFAAVQSR
jgi:hypothetical protein